ncbi:peptidylprolyl isomerase [Xylanimonas allomyrinae]|uniref:Peptidyl-prolyl cis-trans isomerase n=1 Tax=Xylanimonas allomyrinae TaxID=2509459 RepID=A0A4P6ELD5_9MICO|nr:FKBP-type peptidyl-prolyl cis-trans isomerase [Xylanimonas allomyrinae]QAY63185.1 peptidylprolyl isomerase [Xylanimonas allomyrinae]
MNLRITAGAAALALSAALALTGCASGDNDGSTDATASSSTPAADDPTPTAQDVAALAAVRVKGDAGAEPTLEFDAPLSVSVPTTRLVDKGDGEALREGAKLELHYVIFNADGSRAGSTWKEGTNTPEAVTLGDPNLGAINDTLKGANVGARALVANPSAQQDGSTTTMLMLLEVATQGEWRAEGEPVTPPEGLPTVTLGEHGKPSIDIPEGFEPSGDLVAQTLIKGAGPEVTSAQTLTVHYTGWLTDGTQFDSSWDKQVPATFSLQQVIPGWTEGLAGQTVGSQVLLVVPADKGYGAEGKGSIPGGATLIFVVDILAAQ